MDGFEHLQERDLAGVPETVGQMDDFEHLQKSELPSQARTDQETIGERILNYRPSEILVHMGLCVPHVSTLAVFVPETLLNQS